jgi:hypothetical protein
MDEDLLKEAMISSVIFDADDDITFKESYFKGGLEVSNGSDDYLVFDDWDDARHAAEDDVKNFIDQEGIENMVPSFVADFVYISDTDKNIIANEEADARAEDMDESDLLRERDVSEEDIESENYDIDQLRTEYAEAEAERVRDILDSDPIGYFEDSGYSREDVLKLPVFSVDVDALCEEAVKLDGVAHFLASYDGDEVEFEDRNGKKYWAYRTN